VKIYMIVANPGTTLSCAVPTSAAAGQGAGMRRASEDVRLNEYAARLRHVTEWSRAASTELFPVNADSSKVKQPKIHVPQPPQERSP
jgi:hypothetical protein